MMRSATSRSKVGLGLGCLTVGLLTAGGCGGIGRDNGRIDYASAEEISQQKADLFAAMKGGAYGSSGRRNAARFDPLRK